MATLSDHPKKLNFMTMAFKRINSIASLLKINSEENLDFLDTQPHDMVSSFEMFQSDWPHLTTSYRGASWSPSKSMPNGKSNQNRQHAKCKQNETNGIFYIHDEKMLHPCTEFPSNSRFQQSSNYRRPQLRGINPGSLESIDMDDDYSSTNQSLTSLSSDSGQSTPDCQTPPAALSRRESPVLDPFTNLDDSFASSFGYQSIDEISAYYRLNDFFNLNTDQSLSPNTCSRLVNRFGFDCQDVCQFPLVLPRFSAELLRKRHGSYVTWEQIMLQADACLASWEFSALNNLRRRFPERSTPSAVLGKPIDFINVDPNHNLRKLCGQLDEGKIVHHLFKTAKHQQLKRWSSTEDLMVNSVSGQNICPKVEKKLARTDDSLLIDMERPSQPFNHGSQLKDVKGPRPLKLKNGRSCNSSASFNKLISSISAQHSFTHSDHEGRVCGSHWSMISQNSLLYRELDSLLQHSSSAHFCVYVTKFHLEHFRFKINNVLLISSLVLLRQDLALRTSKNAKSKERLNDVEPSSSSSWRNNLLQLLTFDDTLVSVVRHYLTNNRSIESRQKCLANLIECACLMRQMRNFHGLQVLVGAIQSPEVYFDRKSWAAFNENHPGHFRDYVCLSKLGQKLSSPSSMLTCAGYCHIPPLHSIINRLRLNCSTAWNIFDARRRYKSHSLAVWIEQMVGARSIDQSIQSYRRIKTLNTNLYHDPVTNTFLSNCSDNCLVIKFDEFPQQIQRRLNIGSMPQRFLQTLISQSSWRKFISAEINQSFVDYELPDRFY